MELTVSPEDLHAAAAAIAGCAGRLESARDGIAGECFAAAGGEERVSPKSAALGEPCADDGGRVSCQRGDALLAAFAAAGDVGRRCEMEVIASEAGEFGDA